MPRHNAQPENVIFWGAGATRELGIRTTVEQAQFVRRLTGASDPSKPLADRVAEALADKNCELWHSAFVDLIDILGDGDDANRSIHNISGDQLHAMRRNWRGTDEELSQRIIDLRLTYDWPALKSAVTICPGSTGEKFRLNDLFNLLDMHIPPGSGFRAPTGGGDLQFLDARRLIGAKNALVMILIASFYVDYQTCISSKRDILEKYKDAAILLGRRMQRQGQGRANRGVPLETSSFYQGDTGFVSMNYDPILFWVQFVANRELNHSASVPHIGSPAVPLHLFNDFSHFIPSRRIGRGDANSPWYPMNEAVTQRLNESTAEASHRVRLTKVLFPHGCLCWRECPDCGKLSAYHADRWDLTAVDLLPPPPLLSFDASACPDRITGSERDARGKGEVDARSCLHCGTLTFANHTQVVMQSSFKPRPPSFIEEIQRDLRATVMGARHIILMGYSLPPDDVTYRAFFSARRQREGSQVRCTVVNKDTDNAGWYGPRELHGRFKDDSPVVAACEVFGEDNVRFYGGGIPQVFLDSGVATDANLHRLLEWS